MCMDIRIEAGTRDHKVTRRFVICIFRIVGMNFIWDELL